MSRIFLSHSSIDEREAVALCQWLAGRGLEDVFLDVDPKRGLAAGERWQDALRAAADRCEAVVFMVSPAWAASKWCLAEFLLAQSLHKRIFGVQLAHVSPADLPREMTSEWQLCRLTGAGVAEIVRFQNHGRPDEVTFLREGLERLRDGLRRAGLGATHFSWPPPDERRRSPYRGLEPLEAVDAAVFFGRDVEILRAMDALRGMRGRGAPKLFIVLGASGAGKSSFLRAGILPRLEREDQHFLPLPPIRPERDPLDGDRGLAQSLHRAHEAVAASPMALGRLKGKLREGPAGLARVLADLRAAALARFVSLPADATPPTLVLAIDQAEELFQADAGPGARQLLGLIGELLRGDGEIGLPEVDLIVAFTIRSDSYAPLQTAPELAGLQSVVFDQLKPMPSTRYREVIAGPALRATESGKRVDVDPDLVDQLVEECRQGGDALPLLGLTLSHLYRDFGAEAPMTLDNYVAMGGLERVVKTEIEAVLSQDPVVREAQLRHLRAAFIPWLATVNDVNGLPLRRVARLSDLPSPSRPLVLALAERRLLLTDQKDGEVVVEVAHEALLRQWDVLVDWLAAERVDLLEADTLERACRAWEESGQRDAWLFEADRLATAEVLAASPAYAQRLRGTGAFLLASRQREDARRIEADRAMRESASQRARRRTLAFGVLALTILLLGGSWGVWEYSKAQRGFDLATRSATAGRAHLLDSMLYALAATKLAPESPSSRGALLSALMNQPAQLVAIWKDGNSAILALASHPTLDWVASASTDGTVSLWRDGLRSSVRAHDGATTALAFYHTDGLVSGGADGALRWMRIGPQGELTMTHKQQLKGAVLALAFDGQHTLAVARKGAIDLIDSRHAASADGAVKRLNGVPDDINTLAFDASGRLLAGGRNSGITELFEGADEHWKRLPPFGDCRFSDPIRSVQFRPRANELAVSYNSGEIVVFDVADRNDPLPGRYALRDPHQIQEFAAAYLDNGDLVVGNARHELIKWSSGGVSQFQKPIPYHAETCRDRKQDPAASATRDYWVGHGGKVLAMTTSSDGSKLYSADETGAVFVWNVRVEADSQKLTASAASVAFSPDSRVLAVGRTTGRVDFYDVETGQPAQGRRYAPPAGHAASEVRRIVFDRTGDHLLVGTTGADAEVWTLDGKGKPVVNLSTRSEHHYSWALAFHERQVDAPLIVDGAFEEDRLIEEDPLKKGPLRIRVYGLDGVQKKWTNVEGRMFDLVADHDRLLEAVGGSLRLRDANDLKKVCNIGRHNEVQDEAVRAVAFNPSDSSMVASGGEDQTVRLWHLCDEPTKQPGSPLSVFKTNHRDAVSIAFDKAGSVVAAGTVDGYVVWWDVATGNRLADIEAHPNSSVWGMAASPNGKWIATAATPNFTRDPSIVPSPAVRLWPAQLDTESLVRRGCELLRHVELEKEWATLKPREGAWMDVVSRSTDLEDICRFSH